MQAIEPIGVLHVATSVRKMLVAAMLNSIAADLAKFGGPDARANMDTAGLHSRDAAIVRWDQWQCAELTSCGV